MRGGVRGRKAKVGRKLLRFPPTRLSVSYNNFPSVSFVPSARMMYGRYSNIIRMPGN
jgi:hypothetical protein